MQPPIWPVTCDKNYFFVVYVTIFLLLCTLVGICIANAASHMACDMWEKLFFLLCILFGICIANAASHMACDKIFFFCVHVVWYMYICVLKYNVVCEMRSLLYVCYVHDIVYVLYIRTVYACICVYAHM